MDDGMQFAHEGQGTEGPDTTKTIYKCGYTTFAGTSWKYIGNDQAEYEAELAKMEAKNTQWEEKKGWKPRTRPFEIATEIIEPEQVQEPQEASEEVSDEAQTVEVQASTQTIEVLAARGREQMKNFEVRDEYDAKVKELGQLAERLPNGYAIRLHQDHIPLSGVIVRYDDSDGRSQQRVWEGPYAISEAREHLQKMLPKPGRSSRNVSMLHEELYSPVGADAMKWDEGKQEYIGSLLDRRRIHVSGDVWSEQVRQGVPERALENPITWEPDIDGEKIYVEEVRKPMGRPKRIQGDYERISLEIRKDLLAFIDFHPGSRREYIEQLLRREMER